MSCETDKSLSIPIEIFLKTISDREQIIIEIKIFLIKSLNTMKIHFKCVGIECRQILSWYEVLVQYHIHCLSVHPCRHLAFMRQDKKDLSDEGHMLFYPSEKKMKGSPVPKPFCQNGPASIFLIVGLPHRIKTVDICNDNIHALINYCNLQIYKNLKDSHLTPA